MDTDLKRRQVSFDQLTSLLDFLKEHPELAKGLTRGRRGKIHTTKVWNTCAKKLNVNKDGTTKDGKGWAKYWCDWKYRVRRKALELRAAKESNRPLPDGVTQLTSMEETILSIIGDNAVDGVVIKSDPLAEVDSADEEPENNDNGEDVTVTQSYESVVKPTRRPKRHHSTKELSDVDDRGGPSSPVERKPRLSRVKNVDVDSEADEDTTEFLRIEKEKLENSRKMLESIQTIASEMTRLTDVMSHIRDFLINNRIHI